MAVQVHRQAVLTQLCLIEVLCLAVDEVLCLDVSLEVIALLLKESGEWGSPLPIVLVRCQSKQIEDAATEVFQAVLGKRVRRDHDTQSLNGWHKERLKGSQK